MPAEKILEIVLREMQAIANGWRSNWSEFDGRTLRDQVRALVEWADRDAPEHVDGDYTEGTEFAEEQRGW